MKTNIIVGYFKFTPYVSLARDLEFFKLKEKVYFRCLTFTIKVVEIIHRVIQRYNLMIVKYFNEKITCAYFCTKLFAGF